MIPYTCKSYTDAISHLKQIGQFSYCIKALEWSRRESTKYLRENFPEIGAYKEWEILRRGQIIAKSINKMDDWQACTHGILAKRGGNLHHYLISPVDGYQDKIGLSFIHNKMKFFPMASGGYYFIGTDGDSWNIYRRDVDGEPYKLAYKGKSGAEEPVDFRVFGNDFIVFDKIHRKFLRNGNPKEVVFEYPKDEFLPREWGVCQFGIVYGVNIWGSTMTDIYINNRQVKLITDSSTWQPHPKGYLLCKTDGRILLNGRKLLATVNNNGKPIDYRAHPYGVIVREEANFVFYNIPKSESGGKK